SEERAADEVLELDDGLGAAGGGLRRGPQVVDGALVVQFVLAADAPVAGDFEALDEEFGELRDLLGAGPVRGLLGDDLQHVAVVHAYEDNATPRGAARIKRSNVRLRPRSARREPVIPFRR